MQRSLMYYTAANHFPAVCEVSIFTNKSCTVVVVTDEDTGPSVTNNIEEIAKELCSRGIKYDFLVEHYRASEISIGAKRAKDSETWDFVSIHDNEPTWVSSNRQHIEDLIGGPYPD